MVNKQHKGLDYKKRIAILPKTSSTLRDWTQTKRHACEHVKFYKSWFNEEYLGINMNYSPCIRRMPTSTASDTFNKGLIAPSLSNTANSDNDRELTRSWSILTIKVSNSIHLQCIWVGSWPNRHLQARLSW